VAEAPRDLGAARSSYPSTTAGESLALEEIPEWAVVVAKRKPEAQALLGLALRAVATFSSIHLDLRPALIKRADIVGGRTGGFMRNVLAQVLYTAGRGLVKLLFLRE
jgi:hypothetical protein